MWPRSQLYPPSTIHSTGITINRGQSHKPQDQWWDVWRSCVMFFHHGWADHQYSTTAQARLIDRGQNCGQQLSACKITKDRGTSGRRSQGRREADRRCSQYWRPSSCSTCSSVSLQPFRGLKPTSLLSDLTLVLHRHILPFQPSQPTSHPALKTSQLFFSYPPPLHSQHIQRYAFPSPAAAIFYPPPRIQIRRAPHTPAPRPP